MRVFAHRALAEVKTRLRISLSQSRQLFLICYSNPPIFAFEEKFKYKLLLSLPGNIRSYDVWYLAGT